MDKFIVADETQLFFTHMNSNNKITNNEALETANQS